MLEICNCKNIKCQFNPKNHDKGCTPCIVKNLNNNEIPACFWHNISKGDISKSKYSFLNFAAKVMEKENEKISLESN